MRPALLAFLALSGGRAAAHRPLASFRHTPTSSTRAPHVSLTASLAIDGISGAGGAGGIGGRGGGRGGGDWNGDEGEGVDTHALLTDAGLHADAVPPDVLTALRAGRIGLAELTNWKAVLNSPLARLLASVSYVRDRLLAEPRLLSVLAIEIGLGSACSLTADLAARGPAFVRELDFVLANQVVITLTNTALVLMLSPAASIGAPAASANMLPGYFLQSGAFSASQRAACFAYRAAQFAAVGVATAAAGQALTMGLVGVRSLVRGVLMPPAQVDTEAESTNVELAPIGPTCTNYAVFMGASSNTRYQIVNSMEARCVHLLPAPARVPISASVRLFNNYIGSASWIWWAKRQGLQ
mmetsp:Transcript_8668/g.26666  ORF Transcript_8668/g.26666 Transcript_8668/m.26666 type:complete len:354 (-) Transcript_8668:619-1680(-)